MSNRMSRDPEWANDKAVGRGIYRFCFWLYGASFAIELIVRMIKP